MNNQLLFIVFNRGTQQQCIHFIADKLIAFEHAF